MRGKASSSRIVRARAPLRRRGGNGLQAWSWGIRFAGSCRASYHTPALLAIIAREAIPRQPKDRAGDGRRRGRTLCFRAVLRILAQTALSPGSLLNHFVAVLIASASERLGGHRRGGGASIGRCLTALFVLPPVRPSPAPGSDSPRCATKARSGFPVTTA